MQTAHCTQIAARAALVDPTQPNPTQPQPANQPTKVELETASKHHQKQPHNLQASLGVTSRLAMDGTPKDYSSMYCEDAGLNFTSNRSSSHSAAAINVSLPDLPPPLPPIALHRTSTTTSSRTAPNATKSLADKHDRFDGRQVAPKHREQLDLAMVVAKLKQLPKEDSRAYAMGTLNEHYTSFTNRRRVDQNERTSFRVCIQYSGEKDTYVVRVNQNTLKAIKDKMPKRGNYRYFFRSRDLTCEELESDDSMVPYHEKDGRKLIYCQVFPY